MAEELIIKDRLTGEKHRILLLGDIEAFANEDENKQSTAYFGPKFGEELKTIIIKHDWAKRSASRSKRLGQLARLVYLNPS
jgi:hypothetical protein